MSGALRDGVVRFDKPVGPTSHDMVAIARRELGIRKVGHSGTLDPFASGLLLLCLGPSTRLAEYLSDLPKEYSARARLGVSTTTADPEGEVVGTSDAWESLVEGQIDSALQEFVGETDQMPPAFSAKKVGGERAYRLARRGEDVSLAAASVSVYRIALDAVDLPFIDFTVLCSTGTYVRGIARDVGEQLRVGAHLTELRRVAIGPFQVEGAVLPGRLGDAEAVRAAWIPPLEAVAHLPLLQDPSEETVIRLRRGQGVPIAGLGVPEGDEGGEVAVVCGERLVAIAVRDGDQVRPRKVFPLE
ncbi:MAG: tRNA pseudouridine(55) synthase TruB [Gemmatimonadetes bacterium]|nr:tRNA pseudouridine(55) synthase TruB [Gemmatimonadota bacterium]